MPRATAPSQTGPGRQNPRIITSHHRGLHCPVPPTSPEHPEGTMGQCVPEPPNPDKALAEVLPWLRFCRRERHTLSLEYASQERRRSAASPTPTAQVRGPSEDSLKSLIDPTLPSILQITRSYIDHLISGLGEADTSAVRVCMQWWRGRQGWGRVGARQASPQGTQAEGRRGSHDRQRCIHTHPHRPECAVLSPCVVVTLW